MLLDLDQGGGDVSSTGAPAADNQDGAQLLAHLVRSGLSAGADTIRFLPVRLSSIKEFLGARRTRSLVTVAYRKRLPAGVRTGAPRPADDTDMTPMFEMPLDQVLAAFRTGASGDTVETTNGWTTVRGYVRVRHKSEDGLVERSAFYLNYDPKKPDTAQLLFASLRIIPAISPESIRKLCLAE